MMGKQVGTMIGAKDLSDFEVKIKELKVGIPEIQLVEEDHIVVKLYECITCAGFVYTGEMFCDMKAASLRDFLKRFSRRKRNPPKQKAGQWDTTIASSRSCFTKWLTTRMQAKKRVIELELALEEEKVFLRPGINSSKQTSRNSMKSMMP